MAEKWGMNRNIKILLETSYIVSLKRFVYVTPWKDAI